MQPQAKEIELIRTHDLYDKCKDYNKTSKQRNDSFMSRNKKRLQLADTSATFSGLASSLKTIESDFLPAAERMSATDLTTVGTMIPFIGTLIAELSTFIAAASFARRYYQNKSLIKDLPDLIVQCKLKLNALFKDIETKMSASTDQATTDDLLRDLIEFSKMYKMLFYLCDLKLLIDTAYRIMWMNLITGSVVAIATGLFSPFGGTIAAHVSQSVKSVITLSSSLVKKTSGTFSIRNNTKQRCDNDTDVCSYIDRLYELLKDIPDESKAISTTENISDIKATSQSTQPTAPEADSSSPSISQTCSISYTCINRSVVTKKLNHDLKKSADVDQAKIEAPRRDMTRLQLLQMYKTQVTDMKTEMESRKNNNRKVSKKLVISKALCAIGGLFLVSLAIATLFLPGGQVLSGCLLLLAYLMNVYGSGQCVHTRYTNKAKIPFEKEANDTGPQLFKLPKYYTEKSTLPSDEKSMSQRAYLGVYLQ